MPTEQILSLLVAERDRLNRAIEALQGAAKHRGRPAKSNDGAVSAKAAPAARRTRKPMTPAQKKAHSNRMKAFWAERRKQASKG